MLKIRRPLGRLIFNMGIAIPGKTVFLIETAPWSMNYYPMFGITSNNGTYMFCTSLVNKFVNVAFWLVCVCIFTDSKDCQFDNFVVPGGTISCHNFSLRQLMVPPVTSMLSNWRSFVFSVCKYMCVHSCTFWVQMYVLLITSSIVSCQWTNWEEKGSINHMNPENLL